MGEECEFRNEFSRKIILEPEWNFVHIRTMIIDQLLSHALEVVEDFVGKFLTFFELGPCGMMILCEKIKCGDFYVGGFQFLGNFAGAKS